MKVEVTEHSAVKVVRLKYPLDRLETQGRNTLQIYFSDGSSQCWNPKVFAKACRAFWLLVKAGALDAGREE